jgi:hypothetical protein
MTEQAHCQGCHGYIEPKYLERKPCPGREQRPMDVDPETFHDAWVERGMRCDGDHSVNEALCQNVTAVLVAVLR